MKFVLVLASVAALLLAKMEGCEKSTVRGPAGKQLTLAVPESFSIQRGAIEPLQIGLKRENFAAAVRVSLSKLPKGVSARQDSQTVETNAATFVLEASKDADLVTKQAVTVTAVGPDGMTVTENVELTVKE